MPYFTPTIQVEFDPKSLPTWARRNKAVVELSKRDLAFRVNVHDAQTQPMRRVLIRQAERAQK